MSYISPVKSETLASAVRGIGQPPRAPAHELPISVAAVAAAPVITGLSAAREEMEQALLRKRRMQGIQVAEDGGKRVVIVKEVKAVLRPLQREPILHDERVFRGVESFLPERDFMVLGMVSKRLKAFTGEYDERERQELAEVAAMLQAYLPTGSRPPDTSGASRKVFYQKWYRCLIESGAIDTGSTEYPPAEQIPFFNSLMYAVEIRENEEELMSLLRDSPKTPTNRLVRSKAKVLTLIYARNPALAKGCFFNWVWGVVEDVQRLISPLETTQFNDWLSEGNQPQIDRYITGDKFNPFRDFVAHVSDVIDELVALQSQGLLRCVWDTHTMLNETHVLIFEHLLEKQWASVKSPEKLFALLQLMTFFQRRRLLSDFLAHKDYVKQEGDTILPSLASSALPGVYERVVSDESFRKTHLAYSQIVGQLIHLRNDFKVLSPKTEAQLLPFTVWSHPEFLAYCTSSSAREGAERYGPVWRGLLSYLEDVPERERYVKCIEALLNLSYICSDEMRVPIMTKALLAIYRSSVDIPIPEDEGLWRPARSFLVAELGRITCPNYATVDNQVRLWGVYFFGYPPHVLPFYIQNDRIYEDVRQEVMSRLKRTLIGLIVLGSALFLYAIIYRDSSKLK